LLGRWTNSEHNLDRILDTPENSRSPFRIDTQNELISDKNVVRKYIGIQKKERKELYL